MDHFILWFVLLGLGILALILLMVEVGRRSGRQSRKHDAENVASGSGVTDAAVFGLMGLLIAFTFSGAASRFDARRQMIVEEANTMGTAYLRIDLLPANFQAHLRENFRKYVETRLAIHRQLANVGADSAEMQKASTLQREIWAQALAGCRETGSPAVMTLVMGSLNEMFDTANTRTESVRLHPPLVIHVMLIVLVLACSLLAGNVISATEKRNWVQILGFANMLSLTVLVILDLEYPRIGVIRIDTWDRVLMEVRANMN
jgi:hypothetical protein